MANGYIVLNGKRYVTANQSFVPKRKKARQINATLGAKVLTQTFALTDYRWSGEILVEITPADSNYGSVADLQTAYDTAYVSFTDIFGVAQGDVIMEGELNLSYKLTLVDAGAPFEVSISLRKRQP